MTVVKGIPAIRVMDAQTAERTIRRLAHELVERHRVSGELVIVAIRGGGIAIARALAAALAQLGQGDVRRAVLDVSAYRDDVPRTDRHDVSVLTPDGDGWGPQPTVDGCVVILVDDVVQTGRTLRAALDSLSATGRPNAIEALVLIDRGHRELPIRPTFVGKNIPAAADDWVEVILDERPGADPGVFLVKRP